MKAVTVIPGKDGSAALAEVDEPDIRLGTVLVKSLAVGVCGTDVEIASGQYGWPPAESDRLILGHESLGQVVDPGSSGFEVGDHLVGIVRRPDRLPCPNCAVGEWDMCSNGGYTERGIKEIDGFMSERWRIEPEYAVRVDTSLGTVGVLLEPTSVVTKAWAHIIDIGHRTFWDPEAVLVIGAGPIGLLAALIGRQLGRDVHVLDRATEGPKPDLVAQLGAHYHTGRIAEIGLHPDIVIECTGVVDLALEAATTISAGGILCLTGVGPGTARMPAMGLASQMVLKNLVAFGSVNANRRHYYRAARVLARADRSWLERLITRRVPPDSVDRALQKEPDDIKVVVEFASP